MAIIASLGLPGAYGYFILKRREFDKESVFLSFGVVVLITALLCAVMSHLNIITAKLYFLILYTLIFAIQRLYSSKLKCEGKGYFAVLIDGGYYFVLAGVIVCVWLYPQIEVLPFLLRALELYIISWGVCVSLKFFRLTKKCQELPFSSRSIAVLKYSYKLILSGFIIFWLTSSARIYINFFLGAESVGIYSYYYRIAGMAYILYQFIYIAFYQKIYLAESKKMDEYYVALMAIVTISCLMCIFIVPFLSSFFNKDVAARPELYILLSLQMPIWIGTALCEGAISRENVVMRQNIYIGVIVAIFPLLLFCVRRILTLELFTFLNTCDFAVALIAQIYILKDKGIFLRKCLSFSIVIFIISIVVYIYFLI
jgi:O-antigen/teichoic acid export membrane protein